MGPRKLLGLYDLWNADSKDETKPISKSKLHPSSKRTIKKPLPHPGQSYNPHPEDHARLLKKIAKDELKFQTKQTNINKATRVKVNANELRKHEREELVSGIKHLIKSDDENKSKSDQQIKTTTKKINSSSNLDSDHDDDDDGSSTDSAYSDYDEKDFEAMVKDKKVEEKRKTKRQRLAQLKDKLQRKAAKLRKAKNIRLTKFDALKKLNKELDRRDRELAIREKKRHRTTRNQRLGPKFEQSDPIYRLSGDLPSSLRETSCPMDAIVREQLESFQSRLMVEPSHFQIKKRKYKKRAFERSDPVEDDGSVIASDMEGGE